MSQEKQDFMRQQQIESEMGVATEAIAVRGVLTQILEGLNNNKKLEKRVEQCDSDIAELKERVG